MEENIIPHGLVETSQPKESFLSQRRVLALVKTYEEMQRGKERLAR